jgi:hypothetical protein
MSFEHFEGLVIQNRRRGVMYGCTQCHPCGCRHGISSDEFNNRKLIGNTAVLLSSEYSHKSGSVMRSLPHFSEPEYNVQHSGTIHYLYCYVIRNLCEIKFVETQENIPSLLRAQVNEYENSTPRLGQSQGSRCCLSSKPRATSDALDGPYRSNL